MCASRMNGASALSRWFDANRKRAETGKDWEPVGRMLVGEAHHAVCTLRPASVPIIPTTFDTVALVAVPTTSTTLSKLW